MNKGRSGSSVLGLIYLVIVKGFAGRLVVAHTHTHTHLLYVSVLPPQIVQQLRRLNSVKERLLNHPSRFWETREDLPSFCLSLLLFNNNPPTAPHLFPPPPLHLFPHLITAQEISSISPDLLTHANEAGVMEACVTHY